MKTNQIAIGALIITLGTSMGVNASMPEIKPAVKIEVAVEKTNGKVSEKVFTEFKKLLETKDALQVKEFILDNVQNVTEETADKMVIEYELLLNTNFINLADKYNLGVYFDAINGTMDDQHNLKLEDIQDEKIKEEVMNTIASGYTFKMVEGCHYLTIDYTMINDTFSQYISEDLKPYYELRKNDLEHPTFVGDYVNIDFEEIKNRVVTLEKAIRDNKELADREDIKDLMKWEIQALLTVNYFNQSVDYTTGKVDESVKSTYEELKASDLQISKHAAEEMDNLLTELGYVLKIDDDEAYEKVNSLKFKIADEVGKKVEEYYQEKQAYSDDDIMKLPSGEIDFSNISYQVSETDKDVKLEEAITKALEYDKEINGAIRYYYNRVDLNGDGKDEVFVYLIGPYVSGTGGSTAVIFEKAEDEYKLVSKISLARNPIIVSDNETNGWKDLIMYVSGGGIEPFYSEIKFDGKEYPINPSVQPQVKKGTIVEGKAIIADDILKNCGIELQ